MVEIFFFTTSETPLAQIFFLLSADDFILLKLDLNRLLVFAS